MTSLNIPGIGNGYIVDQNVWRGAQPVDAAWAELAQKGCKSVLDLNNVGEVARAQFTLVNAEGMNYISFDWSGVLPPSQNSVRRALTSMDNLPHPIFVHCQHGSDRTGTLCACWRIYHDGWGLEKAIDEAFTALGLDGMHEFWMAAAVAQFAHDLGKV